MCNIYVARLLAAIWTIIQTTFHLIWTVWGYYAYMCKTVPSHYYLVFVYLTYFYRNTCGKIKLEDDEFFIELDTDLKNGSINSSEYSMYNIVKEILRNASLPEEAFPAARTHIYIKILIVSDIVWVISAVLLFVGTLLNAKKIWALIVYGPWLILTGLMVVMDVLTAVHFGLDIINIRCFTNYLRFIGVENYNDFKYLDNVGSLNPVMPSIIFVCLSSRFFIFWIPNVYAFFCVLNAAIVAFQLGPKPGKSTAINLSNNIESSFNEINLNSSQARIRKWQLFYGAAETSKASAGPNDLDLNSNSRTSSLRNSRKKHVMLNEPPMIKILKRRPDTISSNGCGYSQNPWSYGTLPDHHKPKTNHKIHMASLNSVINRNSDRPLAISLRKRSQITASVILDTLGKVLQR
ncbi:unnamed protein product [Brassicogethes aeneus]|uniref:Uncharacterized protein n=1 Tax=Brassicogethes aeneus TaxID=1431903 RepID=A0A9P0AQS3_BRAAE|nr:unnamed protein product [Brassicogethes aeneus]